jgi:hypothetical protein
MDRQARTSDTVLDKSKEMTGNIKALWVGAKHCRGCWGEGEEVKTTENKKTLAPFALHSKL